MSGVVVVGATGGCGTTVLACALALRLADAGQVPLLVDAGMHGTGPPALWGITATRGLDDLLPLGAGITSGHVDHVVHRHSRGVDVVAGSAGPGSALAWSDAAGSLAGHVADRAAWVADAGLGDAPVAMALAQRASQVVLVAPATVQGARRAARMLQAPVAAAATVVATALPGGDRLSARAMRAAMGGRPVVVMDRDDRGARDVADARAPGGRRMTRVLDALQGAG